MSRQETPNKVGRSLGRWRAGFASTSRIGRAARSRMRWVKLRETLVQVIGQVNRRSEKIGLQGQAESAAPPSAEKGLGLGSLPWQPYGLGSSALGEGGDANQDSWIPWGRIGLSVNQVAAFPHRSARISRYSALRQRQSSACWARLFPLRSSFQASLEKTSRLPFRP